MLHEIGDLGDGHRFSVGAKLPHVKLRDDWFQMIPTLFVRDMEKFGFIVAREEHVGVHFSGLLR